MERFMGIDNNLGSFCKSIYYFYTPSTAQKSKLFSQILIFLSKYWGLNINRKQPFYGDWIENSIGILEQFHLIKCSISPDIQIIQQVFNTISYNGTIAVLEILWTKGGYHYNCISYAYGTGLWCCTMMMVYWIQLNIWPFEFDFSTLLWLDSPTSQTLAESPFVKSWP